MSDQPKAPTQKVLDMFQHNVLNNASPLQGANNALLLFEVMIIILYGTCVKQYSTPYFVDAYQMYSGIAIMMFVGFGYLYTFLRRYGMGAVGFTFLITVFCLQWGILTEGFFIKAWFDNNEVKEWGYIHLDIYAIIDAMFLVAAVLISFGAVIGTISPMQILVMSFIECIVYAMNKRILLLGVFHFEDAGGTINIHMFGAFFGLAVSYMLGKPNCAKNFAGGAVADTFSLLGTVFLWIYWPSFNGGGLIPNSDQQQRALINTILALTGSTIASYFTSGYFSGPGKYRPVDIQNATLAGGVAIGAVCHLTLGPFTPILIGASAGFLSTYGYNRISSVLDGYGVYDNCGIFNLHGMPSLIGGAASIILAGYKAKHHHDSPHPFYHSDQWEDQFAACALTLGSAISTGLITGFILYFIKDAPAASLEYQDTPYWEVEDFPMDFAEEQEKIKAGLADIESGMGNVEVLKEIVGRYAAMESVDKSEHSEVISEQQDGSVSIRSQQEDDQNVDVVDAIHDEESGIDAI